MLFVKEEVGCSTLFKLWSVVVKVAVVLDSVVVDTVVMVGASCCRCACKK